MLILGKHLHKLIAYVNIQGDKVDYGKLEEMLKKKYLNDLKSGIILVSKVIDQHEMNVELYLLRAKLSFKMVRPGSL